MNDSFNIIDLLKILIKWRKAIIIITSIAVIGSLITALIMPNYYKSVTTFYAANPALTDRQTLFNTQGGGEQKIEYFGGKKDVDRALSIAKSSSLKAYIIYKFDLFKHYDIDSTNTRYYLTEVNEEFDDNYKPIKTDLGGIEITVYDTDPILAADIANEIVKKIDEVNKSMVLENKKKIIRMFREQLDYKKKEVTRLSDSLSTLRMALSTNNNIKTREKVGVFEALVESSLEELNDLSKLYEQHTLSTSDDISTLAIIEEAYPAEKKSKPIRWLIVVSAFLIGCIVSVISVIIIEKYHQLKPELFDKV